MSPRAHRLHALIFDLDGTLGDTLPVCFAGIRRALETFGVHLTDEEVAARFGPTEEGIIRQLVRPEEGDEAARIYRETYESAHGICPDPFPGIREAVETLRRRGVRLGVATGKGAHGAHVSLRVFGIANLFNAVETGSDEGFVKPDLLRRIAAKWSDLDPAAIAYIGDVPWDVDAAREAGMRGLAAAWWPGADAEGLAAKRPEVLFRSVDDFRVWIEESVPSPRSSL
jgi:phosphoglycolate phosphatase-like HAD superfamily hydrolase